MEDNGKRYAQKSFKRNKDERYSIGDEVPVGRMDKAVVRHYEHAGMIGPESPVNRQPTPKKKRRPKRARNPGPDEIKPAAPKETA